MTNPPHAPLRSPIDALQSTTAHVVGVRPAAEVTPLVGPRRYLHAGPRIALADLTDPMRSAFMGALVVEGEAPDLATAAEMVDAGELEFAPCHEAGGVGAMAGVVAPSTPVVVVADAFGRQSFSPLNEGIGSALRFGSTSDIVLSRVRWMRDVLGPVLDTAIASHEPIDVVELVQSGLRRGDECHNRNVASSSLMLSHLAPSIVRGASREEAAAVLEHMAGNPHFFLPFTMATGKLIASAAHGFDGSSVVTCMAGNGHSFGIRVSGLGDRWFTAPSPVGEPKLFPGFTLDDALPTMGDSFVTETTGLGAFALTAAPAIAAWIGVGADRAAEIVDEMRRITLAESTRYCSPFDGTGYPLGIDVGLVASTGIAPVVNNGIANRRGGEGQVGAGLTRLPIEPFIEAAAALQRAHRPTDSSTQISSRAAHLPEGL